MDSKANNKRKREKEGIDYFNPKKYDDQKCITRKFFDDQVKRYESMHAELVGSLKQMETESFDDQPDDKARERSEIFQIMMYVTGLQVRNTASELRNQILTVGILAEKSIEMDKRLSFLEFLVLNLLKATKHNAKVMDKNFGKHFRKIRTVEREIRRREKGLNWVDKLISHTPRTGPDEQQYSDKGGSF